jgi:nicotinate-nucleotide adenylyltransferase
VEARVNAPRRIGLLGGTFDPPHEAHLALARRALDQLGLDELRWLPAGDPWQKTSAGAAVSPAPHREAMLRLAIAGEPRFVLDRRELERAGPSYTLDSVREIAREQPGATLFLVIGQDQLARLPTWHGWRELLARVSLAVADRPGADVAVDPEVAAAAAMHAVALPPMDISATDIRSRVRRGEPIGALVPPAVAGYIDRHRLYREPARD